MAIDDERDERIRRRAYEIWEKDGKRHGDHERHWHEAADEIDRENSIGSTGGESGLASDLQPGQVEPGGEPSHGSGSMGNEGVRKARSSSRNRNSAGRRNSGSDAGTIG
jgi:hypothetical protein